MRVFLFVALFILTGLATAADSALSPDGMNSEASVIIQECQSNEAKIAELIKQAVGEKDIRWKLCLDDAAVTARGVAASAVTAGARMGDLIGAAKTEAAKGQLALLRGLGDASKKAVIEAQSCSRQLTKVTDGSATKKEHDPRKSGSKGANDGVNEAMGMGFTDDMVTERPGGMKGDDPIDAAGTDQEGGAYETPGSVGDDPASVEDHFQEIADPPFTPVSPEK